MPRRRAQRRTTTMLGRWPFTRFGSPGVQLATLVMVGISALLLVSFVGQVMTGAHMNRAERELQATVTAIEAQNARLKAQLAYAESPAYADKVAREQLGMAKEGDTVIIVSDPPVPVADAVTLQPLPPPANEPNWRGWARALAP